MESAIIPNTELGVKPGLSAKVVIAVVVLAAFTVMITWRARVLEVTLLREEEEPALVSKMAPDFSASTIDGRTVTLADFRGQKKVVVTFWASWCAPCRLEMPSLIKFYAKNHTAGSDFEILAISIDEDPKDVTDFASAQKLNFPVLLDPRQRVANTYEVDGIPTMFVIDKDGKIIYGHGGYDSVMEYQLMRELDLKPKKPGASDASASD
jgi:peroxiredoxin